MVSPQSLCDSCEAINLHNFKWLNSELQLTAYKQYRHVKESARLDCAFCSLLTDSFEDLIGQLHDQGRIPLEWPPGAEWRDRWWIHLLLDRDPTTNNNVTFGLRVRRLRVILGHKYVGRHYRPRLMSDFEDGVYLWDMEYPELGFEVVAEHGSAAARSRDIVNRYTGDNPTAQRRLEALKWLLSECDGHRKCHRERLQRLPTRCVQVSYDEHGSPRLRIQDTMNRLGTYVALSHRWTEATTTSQTTMVNYEARMQGNKFEFPNLPKVYQDTIELARDLGIDLIWIDSLCIIQEGDERKDFYKEANQMAQYYSNAYLTVTATSGSNNHGLYPPWEGPDTGFIRLPYRAKGQAGHQQGHFYVYSATTVKVDYLNHIRHSELLTRGWVFQEWLLSHRVVCFTPRGLFVECKSSDPRNHHGAAAFHNRGMKEPNRRELLLKSLFDLKSLPRTGIGVFQACTLWYRLVEIYSRMALSKPNQDRLLALSGISRQLGYVLGFVLLGEQLAHLDLIDRTLVEENVRGPIGPQEVFNFLPHMTAGIFMFDQSHGALWYPEKVSSIPDAPEIYNRLPDISTYSWASVMRPVVFFDTRQGPFDDEGNMCCSFSQTGFTEEFWLHDESPLNHIECEVRLTGQIPGSNTAAAINVDETVLGPDYSWEYIFGTTLSRNARLLPIRIGKRFTDSQELQKVCKSAGYEALMHRCDWWEVWAAESGAPIGCGTIDEFGNLHVSDPQRQLGQDIFALGWCTEKRKVGSRAFGLLNRSHWILTALFVRQVGDNTYTRVGIGRIFGPSSWSKRWKETPKIRINLI